MIAQSEPRRRLAGTRGVRISWVDWHGDGSPVLGIHGITANARAFDGLARALAPMHPVLAMERAVNDSSAWQRMSIPEAAATWGGSVSVVVGSTRARLGRSREWLIPVFTLSARTSRMHTGVLSLPVPAVVGAAISGFSGRSGARPPPIGEFR